jgi:hypothetical protein
VALALALAVELVLVLVAAQAQAQAQAQGAVAPQTSSFASSQLAHLMGPLQYLGYGVVSNSSSGHVFQFGAVVDGSL